MAENAMFLQVLDACVDRVLKEGDSVEACLASYPEHTEQLEPLLRLAVQTRQTLDYAPAPSTAAVARARLHRAIQQRETHPPRGNSRRSFQRFAFARVHSYRWAIVASTAALLVLLASSGAVAASSGSQPDQPLYPVKRTAERARLALAFDQGAKARLHATYAERRVKEMAAMATKGDSRQIEALQSDLQGSLRQIRRTALPGRVPVVARPADAGRYTFPGPVPPYVPRMMPRGYQGQEARQGAEARELHQMLQSHMQLMELRFRLAMRDAPEPTKEQLRQALASAHVEYQELLVEFQRPASPERR
ncbi:MAG: hypothetical protein HY680_07165 [Chloroflexi bacterium]|nr:hypothetical protein [Chloroflexota bacterium]